MYGFEEVPPEIDNDGYAYIMINDARDETENRARIIRVSPDGSEVKIIVKANVMAINANHHCFAISGSGTIYTIGEGDQIRIYNRDGEQLWRSDSKRKADKERNR